MGAAIAQKWASTCRFGHNPYRGAVGENIFTMFSQPAPTGSKAAQMAVKMWMGEEENYDKRYKRCRPRRVCGQDTQVVWKTSTRLGCGFAKCPADKSSLFVTT